MKDFAMKWMLAAVICAMVAGSAAAQGNNSYANMLSTIQSQNQTWYNQLNSYNRQFGNAARSAIQPGPPSSPQPGAAAGPLPSTPTLPQYPIAATDFPPFPGRLMPDQLVSATPGVTFEQKLALRGSYYQFLEDFEKVNRKNNMAAALAYAVRLSLRAVYGRDLSQAELNQMAWNFNSVLATNPQFAAMAPQQKQALYESLIITGGTIAVLQTQGIQQHDFGMQGQAKALGQMVLRQWLSI